jgi:hypothetical protein
MRPRRTARSPAFDYSLDYATLDLRRRPDLYRVGRGEQGVLLVQPYKDEILPHWRFRTPQLAAESASAIVALFHAYKERHDFVGMDMARKFLQMGYTRARRYANHASGRKYDDEGRPLPLDADPEKAASAEVFRGAWQQVERDEDYSRLKREHRKRYG